MALVQVQGMKRRRCTILRRCHFYFWDISLPITLNRAYVTVMEQQPIDEDAAQTLILAIAAAQYSAINPNQYETIRLRRLFSKHELMTELDAELLQSSVSAILCYRDGTMDIRLKNHQMIGRSETV